MDKHARIPTLHSHWVIHEKNNTLLSKEKKTFKKFQVNLFINGRFILNPIFYSKLELNITPGSQKTGKKENRWIEKKI